MVDNIPLTKISYIRTLFLSLVFMHDFIQDSLYKLIYHYRNSFCLYSYLLWLKQHFDIPYKLSKKNGNDIVRSLFKLNSFQFFSSYHVTITIFDLKKMGKKGEISNYLIFLILHPILIFIFYCQKCKLNSLRFSWSCQQIKILECLILVLVVKNIFVTK